MKFNSTLHTLLFPLFSDFLFNRTYIIFIGFKKCLIDTLIWKILILQLIHHLVMLPFFPQTPKHALEIQERKALDTIIIWLIGSTVLFKTKCMDKPMDLVSKKSIQISRARFTYISTNSVSYSNILDWKSKVHIYFYQLRISL